MRTLPITLSLARILFWLAPIAAACLVIFPAGAQEEKSSTSSKKKATTSKKASPTPKKKSGTATPKASPAASPSASPKATPKESSKATPKTTPKASSSPKARSTPKGAKTRGKSTPVATPSATPEPLVTSPPPEDLPLPTPATAGTGNGTESTPAKQEAASRPLPGVLSTDDLKDFAAQPERVKKLIEAALELSKRKLVYTYGSADPARGGMDCSGSIYYVLREQGYKEVPRDASGQYVWARKNGKFFAVISKKADSFEFSDLQPGDLLFWSGTYKIDRDPPVTHSMIYLGLHKTRGEPILWGASDGRSYEGTARWGVGVFDFKMPRTGADGGKASGTDFLGYARIPDRED